MKKILKWLLVLSALLAIGIAALLYNPGFFKGPLENYLSKLTGYSIRLDGELEISAGRHAELTVTDIHVSSTLREGGGDLVTLGSLSLKLDMASLFEDVISIESLQLGDLKLNLETSAAGVGNWVTTPTPARSDSEDTKGAVVVFENISLSNTTVHYLNDATGTAHVLHIATFHQTQKEDGLLHIKLDGALNERPVEFTGNIGPYANLLQGRNITFSGNGHFGSLNISGNGLIDDLLKPKRPKFSIELQGPNTDEITSMLGVGNLGTGQFSLLARGEEVNGRYDAGIHGSVGDISIGISAQTSDLLSLDEVDLSLAINGPSLGSLTRVFGIKKWPDKPFSLKGDIKRVGTTLNISALTLSIGGTQLMLDALLANFPHLDTSRIKLSVAGDDVAQFRDLLGISGIASGPFEIHGVLDVSADEIELIQVEMKTSLGQATLSGTLGPAPGYIGTKLHVHLQGHDAHEFISVFGVDALPEQPFSLDAHAELAADGLLIRRGVLVTIDDDRLELGGRVAFNPGGTGTDVELSLSGGSLSEVLNRLMGDVEVPDRPYALSGRLQLREEGIVLQNVRAEFEGIALTGDGLIKPGDQLEGSSFSFQVDGKDLSALQNFPTIGDAVDIFVPGQAYRVGGRFEIKERGWLLDNITGQVGQTSFSLYGLISPQPEWVGTDVRFSIKGPDLNTLVVGKGKSELPRGTFETSGQLILSTDQLKIRGFNFETLRAHGKIDLELGWPIADTKDISFDINVWGDDIGHFLPQSAVFDPAVAAYRIETTGQRRGDIISLQQFDATIGNLHVSLKGKVNDDPSEENVAITFSATSADLSALGRLNGEPLPAMALNLKAEFNGNASRFFIHNLDGSLGDSHIAGNVDVSLEGARPKIDLALSSKYIDIRPFAGQPGSDDETAPATNQDRLIPAIQLPMDALSALDGTINLKIDELRHEKDSLRNIVLEAELTEGHLVVPHLSFEGPKGRVNTSFSVHPTDFGKADVTLDLRADKLFLNITGQSSDKLDAAPSVDVILHADGRGANLQELAGSLNGSLYIGSEGGTMEGVSLSVLDTFILEDIFSLIMPKKDSKDDLDLTCAAIIVKITNGMMETDPAFAFTTSQITLVAKGTLDFKTEKIKFNFNATPNQALKISASELFNPYILVGGTLSKPAVGLDPAKVLLHGGAAIGTAGLSILAKGLFDRISTTIPLCEEMLKEVQQQ